MNFSKTMELLVPNINGWLLCYGIFISMIVFLLVKDRFRFVPDLKIYAIAMFGLCFFVIAMFSYIILDVFDIAYNATDSFNPGVFFFATFYSIIAGIVGSLIGFILYIAAIRVVFNQAYQTINLSLIIILPFAIYVMFIKPYQQIEVNKKTKHVYLSEAAVLINEIGLKEIESDRAKKHKFIISTPSFFHDSLDVFNDGKYGLIIKNRYTDSFYTFFIKFDIISTVYSADMANKKYLAVLALLSPLSSKSVLLIFDRTGNCVFEELYEDYPSILSVSKDGNLLLLECGTEGKKRLYSLPE